MVLLSSNKIPRVPSYFPLATTFQAPGCHQTALAFPNNCFSFYSQTSLFRIRSPLLTESLRISFPADTKMFQFPALPSKQTFVPHDKQVLPLGQPALLAVRADKARHSLCTPRHPLDALLTLTSCVTLKLSGLEPLTSCLQNKHSTKLSYSLLAQLRCYLQNC